ncbi:AN1-type domain-containing protein [Meloidogyne graminicola]|uniref:AN1-type domain-containing protein n=1 Tax=Meloidogyne graminicola TaxID=189291 RepID=A0A8S9ZTN1_9BILA|nr:AN1-type domain-containing protein [Meloidogyne graminicola]
MAEFPDVGAHCSVPECRQLDFLPIKCNVCSHIFCKNHHSYDAHRCTKALEKNQQVTICPLCQQPIPFKVGQSPDLLVSDHIDNACKSDRKRWAPKCGLSGCFKRELIKMECKHCGIHFCLGHRHPTDHKCKALNKHSNKSEVENDELLAKRLDEILNSKSSKQMDPEQLNFLLAQQLQMEEDERTILENEQRARRGGGSNSNFNFAEPINSQLNAPLTAPSAFSTLPLNQAASMLAQPLVQLPQTLQGISPLTAQAPSGLAGLTTLGGLNGQLQAIQQLQALQTLGGLGIGLNGLNGLGIPTNGATFIPLGQVLIPTGKEVSAKDICQSSKGGGRNEDNNMQMQNSNNGGFCPPCGNFGCCPGQYCDPCSQSCQQNTNYDQNNNNYDQNQNMQQQYMMGNNGYNEGGSQRKRRKATILTMRKSSKRSPKRELALFNYINI